MIPHSWWCFLKYSNYVLMQKEPLNFIRMKYKWWQFLTMNEWWKDEKIFHIFLFCPKFLLFLIVWSPLNCIQKWKIYGIVTCRAPLLGKAQKMTCFGRAHTEQVEWKMQKHIFFLSLLVFLQHITIYDFNSNENW